jgi:hypothetical protein
MLGYAEVLKAPLEASACRLIGLLMPLTSHGHVDVVVDTSHLWLALKIGDALNTKDKNLIITDVG